MSSRSSSVLVLSILAVFAGALWAQQTTATFYAVVTDSTGGVIPGAAVTLTHEGTGATASKVSDPLGEAVFDFLRVGSYTLRIEAKGFKRLESKGIELTAAQNVRQTFIMEVGALTETVSVEGAATLINTVTSEQLNTYDALRVQDLPLLRRNYTSLLAINSGVTMAAEGVRMNGMGKNGVSYTVDGTDAGGNPEGRYSSNYLQPNLIDIMSIEAIQEVHTIKGVPAAEYGNMVAGQVNLLSRSGTNTWHGSAFENFRAENLDARNQRLARKPGVTFNQFGGSAGGPIKKDRIFVFGVYEAYRERSFTVIQENLYSARLREDMLRSTPSYRLLLDFLPLPTQPSANPDIGLFVQGASSRRDDDHADVKSDIRLGSTSTLSLTYSRGRPTQLIPRHYINHSNDRTFRVWDERGTVNYTTGAANWTSETRFGYHLADMNREDAFFFEQFDPLNRNEEQIFGRRVPRLGFTGVANPDQELYGLDGRNINFDQKYARHAGRRSWKFGFSIRRDCCQRQNPEAVAIGYSTRADLIANIPNSVAPTYGNGDYIAKMYQIGGFAQNDWRVRNDLTLNLGIRYDYFTHLVPKGKSKSEETGFYNPDGLLDTNFTVGPLRPRENPYESDGWVNLGPRFGFAYNVGGKGKTVVRGGFGALFSGQVAGAMWQAAQPGQLVPFRFSFSRAQAAQFNLRWPAYNDDVRRAIEAASRAGGWTNTFSVFNPRLQNPYSMHFTFGFQHELTSNLALESAFVGTRGVKFLMHRWMNEPDRRTGLRPNPRLNVNYYVDETQQLVYTSWQTSLRKRFSRGLSGSVHYTWGKSLSTAGGDIGAYYQGDGDARTQEFFNPRADRGPSTGDITHYFISEWVYDLPRLRSWDSGLARQVLGGWQISGILLARTGDAVSISQGGTGLQVARADYVGGRVYLDDYRKTLQYLNPAAFALVPIDPGSRIAVRPGNSGNNAIRTPGLWNVNFGIAKEFGIREQVKFKVGMDAFNFFNHTNLSGLRTSRNDPFFGQLLGTGGSRLIQLNARLSW